MLPAAEEADELKHHDERAGRGFGETQPVEHLARVKPAMVLDRLLADVRQHRVRAAERHHRRLAKEEPFAEQRVPPTQPRAEGQDRRPPQCETDRADLERAAQGRPRVSWHRRLVVEYGASRFILWGIVASDNEELLRPPPATEQSEDARRDKDQRERCFEEI